MQTKIFRALIDWYRRPPPAQRILDAMSILEWRRSLDIAKAANVGIGQYYGCVSDLEACGKVESRWDDGPIPAERNGHRRRLYRRVRQSRL